MLKLWDAASVVGGECNGAEGGCGSQGEGGCCCYGAELRRTSMLRWLAELMRDWYWTLVVACKKQVEK